MFSKNRFFLIVILMLLASGLTGCGMRSIVARGSKSNLLNKTNIAVPESNIRENVIVQITKWGPESKIITGYTERTEPIVTTLRSKTNSGLSSITITESGEPKPIYKSVWNESKSLVTALKKIGYAQAEFGWQYQIEEGPESPAAPDYSIEGIYPMSLGPNIAPIIVWDIIMGAPSVFLPVPILGNYTWTVDMKIHDGKTGELLSEINKKFDYRIKGLWIWGFIKTALPSYEEDIYSVITKTIDAEIIRLESMRN